MNPFILLCKRRRGVELESQETLVLPVHSKYTKSMSIKKTDRNTLSYPCRAPLG